MERDLLDLMWDRATVAKWTRDDAYGSPVYGATETRHPVRVENKTKLIKGPEGRDILAMGRIFIAPSSSGGLPQLTVRDRITLSDGSHPKILWANASPDERGPYMELCYFG